MDNKFKSILEKKSFLIKGVVEKKRILYGQADRKLWPPRPPICIGGTWKCLYNLNVLMSQSTRLQRHLKRYWGGGKHVRGESIDAKFQRKGRGGPTHCRGHMGWSRLEGCAVIKVLLPPQSLVHESDYCLYLGDCTFFYQLTAFKGRMGAFRTIGESS